MNSLLRSIYSDGTRTFVSNPEPARGETVTIRIRMRKETPIRHVLLWHRQNGAQDITDMTVEKERNGLVYYSTDIKVVEQRLEYRFYLIADDRTWYYNQKGLSSYMPNHRYNFALLSDYRQPAWVKSAVFYQIFPERFANGNPENDVRTGEYHYAGASPIRMENWESAPLPYDKGHCMDFFGGDIDGIRQKIPYLKKLGVTCLYLNPIFRSPSTHKYDCIDYFHVDEHFGGDEALARLSEELHKNQMRLILDISINHTGAAHKWFNKDGLFFDKSVGAYNNPDSRERDYYFFTPGTNSYKGWWDIDTLPDLNYSSDALRQIIYKAEDSVLRKWLRPPYSIDGWRFDVADVMARNNEYQFADEIWPEICAAIKEENPEAYILAEDWDECSERQQGHEWDSPMNYYTASRAIRAFYGQSDFFQRSNRTMRELKRKMHAEDVRDMMLDYYALMPAVFRQNQFNLIDSHDIPRFHNDPAMSKEDVKGAAILQFTLPGAPSLYYGDEADIDGGILTNEDCRYPMPWSKPIEELKAYRLYSRLIELKKTESALIGGGMHFLYAKDHVLAFARFDEKDCFLTVVSSDDEEASVKLPLIDMGIAEITAKTDVFGKELPDFSFEDGMLAFTLSAHGSLLFKVS